MLKMKNLLIMFAIVFFISMIVLMVITTRTDEETKKTSKQFIENIIPVILKDFDRDTFLKYAAPEFLNAVTPDTVGKIFEVYKRLGEFKKIVSAKGKIKVSLSFKKGKITYAKYDIKALFSTGEAKVKVVLIQHDNEWYIYYFKINSKVFNTLDNKSKKS